MATKAFTEKTISLQDGTEITLRPLPIAPLRVFMDAWLKFDKVETEAEGFTVFINCAGISLEKHFREVFDSTLAPAPAREKGQFLTEEYRDYLENTLDLETIYTVLEVCGGLKLNADPKVMEEAAKALPGRI
jgi:hypothetical protein